MVQLVIRKNKNLLCLLTIPLLKFFTVAFQPKIMMTSSNSVKYQKCLSKSPIEGLSWVDLQISASEFRPSMTLVMGQCFNWLRLSKTEEPCWIGVLGPHPICILETTDTTLFALLVSEGKVDDETKIVRQLLREYFRLDVSYLELYDHWRQQCPRMELVCRSLVGVRVVRQDPFECLVSFICSSNNNIKRIALMLARLRAEHGRYLCSLRWHMPGAVWRVVTDSDAVETVDYSDGVEAAEFIRLYQFPGPEDLIVSEDSLRALGVGYRARFISGSAARVLENGGQQWLEQLRGLGRLEVRESLLQLPGVGPKVADCVAVFALDQTAAIPVDTHVWDIAVRDYAPALAAARSLTPTVYEAVGDIFRQRFGAFAGWAHSLLFAAELPDFRPLLPIDMQQDMRVFAEARRAAKQTKREEARARSASKLSAAGPAVDFEEKRGEGFVDDIGIVIGESSMHTPDDRGKRGGGVKASEHEHEHSSARTAAQLLSPLSRARSGSRSAAGGRVRRGSGSGGEGEADADADGRHRHGWTQGVSGTPKSNSRKRTRSERTDT